MKFFGVAEFSCLPVNDSRARALWHYLATGEVQDDDWYRGLTQTEKDQNIHEYIEEHRQQEYTENVVQNTPEVVTQYVEPAPEASDDINDIPMEEEKEEYLTELQKLNTKLFTGSRKVFLKFKKFIKNLGNSNDETRNRKIFDIGSEGKRKIGNTIRVQPRSIARRKYKVRGHGLGSYGRRVQDTALIRQLCVSENSEQQYQAPEHRTSKSNRVTHDLRKAVNEHRPNAKKH